MNKGWQPSSLERLEQSKKAKQYWRKGVNIKIAEPPKFDEIPIGKWTHITGAFTPVQGGGYWQIGTDPGKVNGKEIKTPIEAWVERWIKNELGSIK